MPLHAGARLGPYEVLAPLGAGGMGEVYRARDTRLGREVALKILPEELADDASRRARFEQEARAIAALNHPNIIAIYDVGEGYIVSELVDGESLRGAKFGLRKTVDVAVQIANGLAAAHAAGVVHRDLKPENILLARDGRVKILDFGLAKLRPASKASATETMTVHTEPGVVMGTVGYMSPEQVRGAEADHRSDIFSFGLILHELLAGKRTFEGDTKVEIMTAILKQEAPELPDSVPSGIRQVAANCLEKDPANRFQSARDLSLALSALSQSGTPSGRAAALPAAALRQRAAVLAIAGLATLAAGIAAGRWTGRAPGAVAWTGVMLGGPPRADFPRPSPDGHLLAFSAPDADDFTQIWVMKPETGNRVMLTHDREQGWTYDVSWSPDGTHIYFDREEEQPKGVFSVPVLGGEEQTVLENASDPEALPDGSLLVSRLNNQHQAQLFRYWPDSGKLRAYPLVTPLTVARPFPDGRRAAAVGYKLGESTELRLFVVDLETAELRVLPVPVRHLQYGDLAVAPAYDGKSVLYTIRSGNGVQLNAIPLDGGPIRPLLSLTDHVYSIQPASDGSIYLDQANRPVELVRFPPEGGHATTVASVAGEVAAQGFAALPDGRAVLPDSANGHPRLILVSAGKDPVPLVNTSEETYWPATALGSNEVAFLVGTEQHDIAIATVGAGRITRRIPFDKGRIDMMAASVNGRTIYCAAGGSIWSVPAAGGAIQRVRAGDSVAADPDGHALWIESVEPPHSRLFRVPLDGGLEKEIPLTGPDRMGGLINPGSVRNGRLVTGLGSTRWYDPPGIFDLTTGKSARIPLDYTGDFWGMTWTSDGKVIGEAHAWVSTMWKFTPRQPGDIK